MQLHSQPINIATGDGVHAMAVTQMRRHWDHLQSLVPFAGSATTVLLLHQTEFDGGGFIWCDKGFHRLVIESPALGDIGDLTKSKGRQDHGPLGTIIFTFDEAGNVLTMRDGPVESDPWENKRHPQSIVLPSAWAALVHEIGHGQQREAHRYVPRFLQRQVDALTKVLGMRSIFIDDTQPDLTKRYLSAEARHLIAQDIGRYAVVRTETKTGTFGELWPMVVETDVVTPAGSSVIVPALRELRDEVNNVITQKRNNILYEHVGQQILSDEDLEILIKNRFDLFVIKLALSRDNFDSKLVQNILSRAQARGITLDTAFLKTTPFGLHLPTSIILPTPKFALVATAAARNEASQMGLQADPRTMPYSTEHAIIKTVASLTEADTSYFLEETDLRKTDFGLGELNAETLAQYLNEHADEIATFYAEDIATIVTEFDQTVTSRAGNTPPFVSPRSIEDLSQKVLKRKAVVLHVLDVTFDPASTDDSIEVILHPLHGLRRALGDLDTDKATLIIDRCKERLVKAFEGALLPLEQQFATLKDELSNDDTTSERNMKWRNHFNRMLDNKALFSPKPHYGYRSTMTINSAARALVQDQAWAPLAQELDGIVSDHLATTDLIVTPPASVTLSRERNL